MKTSERISDLSSFLIFYGDPNPLPEEVPEEVLEEVPDTTVCHIEYTYHNAACDSSTGLNCFSEIHHDSGCTVCENTANGAVDDYGDGCEYYETNQDSCGFHDNDNFNAGTMCCACSDRENQIGCQDTNDGAVS